MEVVMFRVELTEIMHTTETEAEMTMFLDQLGLLKVMATPHILPQV